MPQPRWIHRIGDAATWLARLLAYGGGAVLCALAVMTVASVLGRRLDAFGLGPIAGDYELVELGCAMAIFAFLPWCHLKRSHVVVSIVTDRLPDGVQRGLVLLGDLLVAVAASVMAWQLYLGFGEKYPYGSDAFRAVMQMGYKPFFPETSYELQIPVWIPFAGALLGAVAFVLVSYYCVLRAWCQMRRPDAAPLP